MSTIIKKLTGNRRAPRRWGLGNPAEETLYPSPVKSKRTISYATLGLILVKLAESFKRRGDK